MAKNIIQKITDKAERLYELRQKIGEIEEANRAVLEPLKRERDATQDELLTELKKNQLASFKVASGDTFARAVRKGVVVTNEIQAMRWALENRTVRIDSILVNQKLKDAEEIPSGFERTETEYISVRKAKEQEE